jgi:SMI1 / KNR4 family (SUKH-1)
MSAQIERIRALLTQHNPPSRSGEQKLKRASLDEVVAWESLHQISLPDAYRRFITEVANGVSEPVHLYPLEDWWAHLEVPEDPELHRSWPSRPFLPYEDLRGKKDWRELLSQANSLKEDDDWLALAGTIALSDEGCGSLAVLIMTGELRGRICHFDFMQAPVFSPQDNFLDWYEARLNGAYW